MKRKLSMILLAGALAFGLVSSAWAAQPAAGMAATAPTPGSKGKHKKTHAKKHTTKPAAPAAQPN